MARPKRFINCPFCGKLFQASHAVSKYCSRSCAWHAKPPPPKPRHDVELQCEQCGKAFYVAPNRNRGRARFCSRSCLGKNQWSQLTEHQFRPTGRPGRRYRQIQVDGREVREHRYVMEQYLGRKLLNHEHVHHINGDPLDNRIENLVILSNADHQRTEIAERKKAQQPRPV